MVSDRLLTTAAWVMTVATAVMTVASVVLALGATPETPGNGAAAIYEGLVYVSIAALGTAVTAKQPRNAIGWVLQLIALALAINALGNGIYYWSLTNEGEVSGFATVWVWLVGWVWMLAIVPSFIVFPLLFPTGRTLSPRWSIVLRLALATSVVMWFGTAFVPGSMEGYEAVVNPVGIDHELVEIVGWVGFIALAPLAIAAITSLFLRFRRSTGVERQQLKWVATAAALLPVAFVGSGSSDDQVGFLMLLTGILLVAVAVAIAMLRYRLYDIDVVINRTLVYGALTATLALTYLGSVLLLQLALRPVTDSSDLAVAGSTLAVAALFRPARGRIQGVVDRRFYRSRYDAGRIVETFGASLRDQVDLEALGRQLLDVTGRTVHPTHCSLWLKEGGR